MRKQVLITLVLLISLVPVSFSQPTLENTIISGKLKASVLSNDAVVLSRWDIDLLSVVPTDQSILYDVYAVEKGIEYMAILPAKPVSNVVSWITFSEGLTWYYQPPLAEIHQGKDWNVNDTHAYNEKGELVYSYDSPEYVGSYAVYYDKQGGVYGTGKFMHVYRPLVYDSKGSEIWGELKYDNGLLSITIPQIWLDSAVYPVYVDPTFGKTSVGASNIDYATDTVRCSNGTIGIANGLLNTVHFYGQTLGAGGVLYGGVYRDSDLKLIEGELVGTNLAGGALQWWNMSLSGAVGVNASTNYWASVHIDTLGDSIRLKADWVGAANRDSQYDITPWPGSWNDPLTPNGYHGYHYSIYCTYTEGGGPVNNNPNAPIWYSPANDTRYNPSQSVTFYWNFSDPDGGDTQGAYELELDNNSNFASPEIDTGKQASANEYHTATLPALVDLYYVRVRTWDDSDAVGPWNHSLQIIVDQINVTSLIVSDNRINVGASGVITPSGVHVYDSAVWNGTATLNDTLTKAAVALYGYSVSSVTDTDYGLTNFTQHAADPYIIFDRIRVLTLQVNNTNPIVNDYVLLNCTLELEYDNHPLGAGDTVNLTQSTNPPTTWNAGTSVFEEEEVRAVDIVVTYNAITANEATYGITVVNMNGQTVSVTWGTPGTLLILVTDTRGDGLNGSFICIWNNVGALVDTGTTNITGYYDAGAVANGNYTIQATLDYFDAKTVPATITIPATVTLTLAARGNSALLLLMVGILGSVMIVDMRRGKRRRR